MVASDTGIYWKYWNGLKYWKIYWKIGLFLEIYWNILEFPSDYTCKYWK